MLLREEIRDWLITLQTSICKSLEETDGRGLFKTDTWERPGGGGGISRVITGGRIIEKGGVNFSAVWGKAPEQVLRTLGTPGNGHPDFYATGVSIVLHPVNPFVPIIHMNVRYFEMTDGTWWFGGGIDLTPHYVNEDDARFFHGELRRVCEAHHPEYYSRFKAWADDYFFIRHRNETRGVGGIFFDHLAAGDGFTKESRFAFLQSVGNAFAPIYTTLMRKNADIPYDETHKHWQAVRRGRYVEFNLVWDRGTKFGLETDGRTESILMSLPPHAEWIYNYQPAPGSPEESTQRLLVKGISWAN